MPDMGTEVGAEGLFLFLFGGMSPLPKPPYKRGNAGRWDGVRCWWLWHPKMVPKSPRLSLRKEVSWMTPRPEIILKSMAWSPRRGLVPKN